MASSMVVFLGSSETVASVMRISDATEAAFCSVTRQTLGGVLQRDAADLDRVEHAHLDHVAVLAGGGVEALTGGQALDLLGHDGALEAGVVGDGLHGSLERLADDLHADLLVGVGGLDAVEHLGGLEERHAAAGDDALLNGRAGRLPAGRPRCGA